MAKPKRAADHRAANVVAAHIIVADPAEYPGVMQEWAQLIVERAEAPPADWRLIPCARSRRTASRVYGVACCDCRDLAAVQRLGGRGEQREVTAA